jgi:hypothetical protein
MFRSFRSSSGQHIRQKKRNSKNALLFGERSKAFFVFLEYFSYITRVGPDDEMKGQNMPPY